MHNNYILSSGSEIPVRATLQDVRNLSGWYGLLEPSRGSVFTSSWSPRIPGKTSFPMAEAMAFDERHRTQYALLSDHQYSPDIWRHIFNRDGPDGKFLKALSEYAWITYTFQNEIAGAGHVAFCPTERAAQVGVCVSVFTYSCLSFLFLYLHIVV